MTGWDRHQLQGAHGRLHVLDGGEGPVVLLIHGSPVFSHTFRHQLEPLREAGFRVVAPDLLGFGASEGPPAGASFAHQVVALRQLVAQLDLDDIHLVVHDWGGPSGLGALGPHPDRVRQLVLVNTTICPDFRPPLYWRPWIAWGMGELFVVGANLVKWSLRQLIQAARQDPQVWKTYADPLRRRATRRTVLRLERLEGVEAALREAAPLLSGEIPATFLWGHPDPYFRRPALAANRARLPQAGLVELPGAGHFPQEDAPDRFTEALLQLLHPD